MKLIDKDALVAEIERRLKKLREVIAELGNHESYECGASHDIYLYKDILSFLNTLEVKEVDLEKEISKYLYSHLGRPRMELELDWTQCDISFKADKLMAFAKHFFELGLKAQKGE